MTSAHELIRTSSPPQAIQKTRVIEDKMRDLLCTLESKLYPLSPILKTAQGYRSTMECLEQYMPLLYAQYDQYLQIQVSQIQGTVACGKACSHCCSHYVASVEPFELLYIDYQIRTSPHYGAYILSLHERHTQFANLQDHSSSSSTLPGVEQEDIYLHQYFLKNKPCPFLGSSNLCNIYDERPFSCRMYLSLSSPIYCKGSLVSDKQNQNFVVEFPEDIEVQISQVSLLFESLDIPHFLFLGLLRINELYGSL
jgi:Fe-S-cluster containining protein